jgi:hypothetical protein
MYIMEIIEGLDNDGICFYTTYHGSSMEVSKKTSKSTFVNKTIV